MISANSKQNMSFLPETFPPQTCICNIQQSTSSCQAGPYSLSFSALQIDWIFLYVLFYQQIFIYHVIDFFQAVHRQVPILIRTIGSSPDLLGIISDPPGDCQDLLMQVQVVLLTSVCLLWYFLFYWSESTWLHAKEGLCFLRLSSCIGCIFITYDIAPYRFYKPSLMLQFHPKNWLLP